MRQRSEALDMLVKWRRRMEKQIGRKIKELQIGNVEKDMNQFLRFGQNTGIATHFTKGIHGVAKDVNRSLLEKVRWLLSNAGLDKSFWAEAIVYASHLINGSTAIGGKLHWKFGLGKLLKIMICCGSLEVRPTSVPRIVR